MNGDRLFVWRRPDPKSPIEFDEVPYRLASALYSGEECRWIAVCEIENRLRAYVDAGTLVVRSPVELGPHTPPVGEQLRRALLMPVDVIALFAEHGIRLEFIRGEMTDGYTRDGRNPTSIRDLAREAALMEFPASVSGRKAIAIEEKARRREAESEFFTQLAAGVKAGAFKTFRIPKGRLKNGRRGPFLELSGIDDALELLGQLVRHDEAGESGWTWRSRAQNQAVAADIVARHARGFFYLSEAAQLLADAQGQDARKILEDLEGAANSGQLPFRRAFSEVPISGVKVSPFGDWVHVNDVNVLLAERWRVSYRFPELELSAQTEARARPVQAQTQQEEAVLEKTAALGFLPLALPRASNGKSGAKAQVRVAIGLNGLFQSQVVFNKAWQRLRDAGRIRDA